MKSVINSKVSKIIKKIIPKTKVKHPCSLVYILPKACEIGTKY